eukprot:810309-Amorphochlora_amoeboformis.AAC.1
MVPTPGAAVSRCRAIAESLPIGQPNGRGSGGVCSRFLHIAQRILVALLQELFFLTRSREFHSLLHNFLYQNT